MMQELAGAARSAIDALKDQPLSLALVIMNLALLLVFWFILSAIDQHNRERETQIFEQQKHVAELLAKCVVPPTP